MNSFTITAVPERTEVVAGELLLVTTTLTNAGTEPVSLPDPAFAPPYAYELIEPKGERRVLYTASRSAHDASKLGDDVGGGIQMPALTLKPGEGSTATEDLVEYVPGGFKPGEYLLVAKVALSGETIRSAPVELRILPPAATFTRTLSCPLSQVVAAVFDHRESDGSWTLFQTETLGEEPVGMVFRRRVALPGAIDDLALAAQATPKTEGRWFAWLADGKFAAARGWVAILAGRVDPEALGLESPQLARPGFGVSTDGAVFVVAGRGDSGAMVRLVTVSPTGAKVTPAAPLTADLPTRILAALSLTKGPSRLHLVWSEEAKSTTSILARDYDLAGTPLDAAPRTLLEVDGPLAAMEVTAFLPGDIPVVHVLAGPVLPDVPGRSEQQLLAYRVPVTGGEAEKWTLPEPGLPVTAWALAPVTSGRPTVAALYDETVLLLDAEEWTTFARDVRAATGLSFLVTRNRGTWLSWLDPAAGFVNRRIDTR
jgi:hypothetical protein